MYIASLYNRITATVGFRSLKENGLPTFTSIGYTLVKGIEKSSS